MKRTLLLVSSLSLALVGVALAKGAAAKPAGKYVMPKPAELQKKCDAGDQPACIKWADMMMRGMYGFSEDKAKIEALDQKACDAGVLAGCSGLADFKLSQRLGSDVTRTVVMPLFKKACDGDDARGCWGWAMLEDRPEGEKESDREDAGKKAIDLWKKGCDAGSTDDCWSFARFTESPTKHVTGKVTTDAKQSCGSYDKLCASGFFDACRMIGSCYESGDVVPQSDKKAKALYEKGCKAGDTDSCDSLKQLVEDRRAKHIKI